MIAENEQNRQSANQSSELFAQKTKVEISLLDTKIEKLMTAYLESALSLEEYWEMKSKLVNQKQLLKEKLQVFEQKSNNRFELTDKFLKLNLEAKELANERTDEENLHLFKKIGSNFIMEARTVSFEPRSAWRILSDWGFRGGNAEQTALCADAISSPVLDFENLRRRRDSNSRELSLCPLSKRVHSTTMRRLRFM